MRVRARLRLRACACMYMHVRAYVRVDAFEFNTDVTLEVHGRFQLLMHMSASRRCIECCVCACVRARSFLVWFLMRMAKFR